jgi:aspartate kinase
MGARVYHEEGVSKISIVGTGMRTHTGVAERMFAALASEEINMKMITTGDIKISVLVDKADGVRAMRAVHSAFGLQEPRPGAGLKQAGGPSPFRSRPALMVEESATRDLLSLTQQLNSMEDIVVSDVLLNAEEGRITIFDIPDRPGCCSRVFHPVAAGGIVVDMIVQNPTKPGRSELSFSVPRRDLTEALRLTELSTQQIDSDIRVIADSSIARLFVFGVGMRTHTGVARRMFGALAQLGINISMINTSEVCISVVVDRDRGEEALACLKQAFNVT